MAAVHENVHERTGEQDEERQDGGDMRAVPNDEIEGQDDGDAENGPASVRIETSEHGFDIPTLPVRFRTGA